MILFVVEGADREMTIFDSISSIFFAGKNKVLTIVAPAEMNIYMLYNLLAKDDFETDVIEVIRENSKEAAAQLNGFSRDDFAEIYYFFDFDEHGNNLSDDCLDSIDVLQKLLTIFDNETENGKLYISYPMIEAARDYDQASCGTANGNCFVNRIDFGNYKHDSSSLAANNDFRKYTFPTWKLAIFNFIYRICCLFQKREIERKDYVCLVNPYSIFINQIKVYCIKGNIFVLSAIPEFLLDYFPILWNSVVGKRKRFEFINNCSHLINESVE